MVGFPFASEKNSSRGCIAKNVRFGLGAAVAEGVLGGQEQSFRAFSDAVWHQIHTLVNY